MKRDKSYTKIIIVLIAGWLISLISMAGIMYTFMDSEPGRSGSIQANGVFNAIDSSYNIITINGETLEQLEERDR